MRYAEFVKLAKANGWTLAILRSENAPPSDPQLLALMDQIGLAKYERFVLRYERELVK